MINKKFSVRIVNINYRSLDKLLSTVSQILTLSKGVLHSLLSNLSDKETNEVLMELEDLVSTIYFEVSKLRLVPLEPLFTKLKRAGYEIARELGKKVMIITKGGNITLDRRAVATLVDPLIHVIRNAIDHGIEYPRERVRVGKGEYGRVVIEALRRGLEVTIRVSDDGRGIDIERIKGRALKMGLLRSPTEKLSWDEVLKILSTPGFTTKESAGKFSGRGVGMDVVVRSVRSLGGYVKIYSELGRGTEVSLTIPLTAIVIKSLVTQSHNFNIVVPAERLSRIVHVKDVAIKKLWGSIRVVSVNNEVIPILNPLGVSEEEWEYLLIVKGLNNRKYAIPVTSVIGVEEVLIRPLPKILRKLPYVEGVAIIRGGDVGFLLSIT